MGIKVSLKLHDWEVVNFITRIGVGDYTLCDLKHYWSESEYANIQTRECKGNNTHYNP